jgi:FkbM family methyltransferase
MLDYPKLFGIFGIPQRGVVHIGGYVGDEITTYRDRMGFAHILFVEGNPEIFTELLRNLSPYPDVVAKNVLIGDRPGTAELRVTSNGQSSSILDLKHHSDIYPDIVETSRVSCPMDTIDNVMMDSGLPFESYNFLNIDIQGAELLAFQGGERLLSHLDAINTELNYDELYAGCVLLPEVDAFLAARGFVRVDTVSAHWTWGDGFYVRERFLKADRRQAQPTGAPRPEDAERQRLADRIRRLEQERDAILASTSWKLTAPLRAAVRRLKGRF